MGKVKVAEFFSPCFYYPVQDIKRLIVKHIMRKVKFEEIGQYSFRYDSFEDLAGQIGVLKGQRVDFLFDGGNELAGIFGRFRGVDAVPVVEAMGEGNSSGEEDKALNFL